MAFTSSQVLTLTEYKKRLDPNGMISRIVSMATQTNDILMDMPWKEGNGVTTHKHVLNTALPSATWTGINEGIDPVRGETVTVTDAAGTLESMGSTAVNLLDLGGNGADLRMQEVQLKAAGMGLTFATDLFYADTATTPKKIHGFTPRYSDTTNSVVGGNIFKHTASPSGNDYTSIWLIGWGMNTVYGFYPPGTMAGIHHRPVDFQPTLDQNGKTYLAHQDWLKWVCGLAIQNPKFVIRIANIDVSAATADTTGGLISSLIDAYNQMPTAMTMPLSSVQVGDIAPAWDDGGVQWAFYANRTVRGILAKQALSKTANTLTYERLQSTGAMLMSFNGIPIRLCEAITNAETLVS